MENYEDYKRHVTDDILTCIDNMGCQPILFIGSGFSQRYIKTPTWENLLKEMAVKCPLIDKDFAYYKQSYNKDLVKIGSVFSNLYKEWAWTTGKSNFPSELFSEDFDPDIYIKYSVANYLKNVLQDDWRENLSAELKNEIEIFCKISPHAIITTNYDLLIENIFPDYEAIIGQQILKANTFSIGELFKIHGSVSIPETLVLTSSDYDNFIKRKKYLSAKLLTFFAEHPLFFIGYSATDPNIKQILSDIDEIISPDNSVIPNIFIIEWDHKLTDRDYPQREKAVSIEDNHSIRVKSISTSNYDWIFKLLINSSAIENINPKVLRSLLARTYQLVRCDIPRKTVEVDFETLEHAVNSEDGFAKLYGITTINDPSQFNAQYPYTLKTVGKALGENGWHKAHKLIELVLNEKGVNIKSTDNKYHSAVRLGENSETHKYSQAAVDLLQKVKNGLPYNVEL